jgi:CheY-like chemotaxis protein
MEYTRQKLTLNILLADDDADERFFFEDALKGILITVNLKTLYDGVYLMEYLTQHLESLPDVLFLDINMPRKNGLACLIEIRKHEKLRLMPVILYSSCNTGDDLSIYYKLGASGFLEKGKYAEIIPRINSVINTRSERVSIC